ncbi:hypothetical protein ACQJ6L_03795 [Helicobacter pylori]
MVGIKLKATYRFNQNQSVKSNQATSQNTLFKKRFSVFSQR